MYCSECGMELVEGAKFCHKCGSIVNVTERQAGAEAEEPQASAGAEVQEQALAAEAEPGSGPPTAVTEPGSGPTGQLARPETLVWEGTCSPRFMTRDILIGSLLTVVAISAVVFALRHGAVWAALCSVLALPIIWLVFAVRALVRSIGNRYRLTTRRLAWERGFWECQKRQVELSHVEEVRVQQNLLHRIFGVGSVQVYTTDKRARLVTLEGVEQPDQVAELIRACAAGEPIEVEQPSDEFGWGEPVEEPNRFHAPA